MACTRNAALGAVARWLKTLQVTCEECGATHGINLDEVQLPTDLAFYDSDTEVADKAAEETKEAYVLCPQTSTGAATSPAPR